ncbi:MAG: hypothetical protein H7A09_08280 [Oceanospirillaceae bacterium]|nr:hypothetical protein [Oceanospirillaceae bacterium]MCP5350183.1 hypothetical protein [Oceanospirillaceae bacterium]
MRYTKAKIFLFFGIAVSAFFCSADNNDETAGNDYYKNDIDAAIREARENPRAQHFSARQWYERTTAESFEFPPLMGSEMEAAVVEGGIGASAAGDNKNTGELSEKNQVEQVNNEQAQNDQNIRTKINTSVNPQQPEAQTSGYRVDVNSSFYTFPGGDSVSTSGIYSDGTFTSNKRP